MPHHPAWEYAACAGQVGRLESTKSSDPAGITKILRNIIVVVGTHYNIQETHKKIPVSGVFGLSSLVSQQKVNIDQEELDVLVTCITRCKENAAFGSVLPYRW